MEGRVIILNSCEIISNSNIGIEFFLYFSDQGLWRSFNGFDFPAGKFPSIFVFTIFALCGKYFIAVADDSGYYFYIAF